MSNLNFNILVAPCVFLDCDGVINHHEWWKRRSKRHGEGNRLNDIDPASIGLLNQLVERTSCYFIVSSTWRTCHTVGELNSIFNLKGFRGYLADSTPVHRGNRLRGDEIRDWLVKSKARGVTPSGICILDDDSDMGSLLPYLVKTSMETGITQKHVDDACYMLSKLFVL